MFMKKYFPLFIDISGKRILVVGGGEIAYRRIKSLAGFSPFISVGGFSGGYKSIIVCFVPRILIGLSAYHVYAFFKKMNREKTGLVVAGAVGSMVNTILVMSFIYLLFRNEYTGSMKTPIPVEDFPVYIAGIIGPQGVREAFVSSILTFAVSNALIRYKNSM